MLRRRTALLAMMLLTACTPRTGLSPAVTPPSLAGPTWTLIELGGQPVEAGPNGRLPDLTLAPGETRFGGYGGCNRLTGTYETKGAELRFGKIAMTRMACPATMQLEQAFVTTLEATDSYRIEGSTLALVAAGKVRARLRVH